MIEILIKKNGEKINSFTVNGHANYDKKGKDIVCAGVTAVTFGTVNAIEKLCGQEPDVQLGKDGFLFCDITNIESQEKAQLLTQGMIVSLETIVRDYSKYVKIDITES